MVYERNLVLVFTEHFQGRSELEEIRDAIERRAPDIEVFLVTNGALNAVTRRHAFQRPAVVFSPVPLHTFRPPRGKVYEGRWHSKAREIERLAAGHIRVPDSVLLERETRLDPATWGPFTVLKPNRGKGGGGVRLVRTQDVVWTDPYSLAPDNQRYGVKTLAQRFIDTGRQPTCHRVTVFLGRPIWATTSQWLFPLRLSDEGPVETPIAANHGERSVVLNYDREIIAFGASIAAVFPEIPVLGVDVVREEATGLLYALEVNAIGEVWHSSSDAGQKLRQERGLDLGAQFGLIDIVADSLIDVTRREAA